MISPAELKRLNEIDPDFKNQVIILMDNLEYSTEIEWTIVQGTRTIAYQNSLYDQGRKKDKNGKIIGSIVTRAKGGQSPHNFKLAVDICPMKDGKLWWDAPDKYWNALGNIAEGMGLVWGGHFKSILDKPHVESPLWKARQLLWKQGKLVIE